MKKIIISEAKFVSLFDKSTKPNNDIFYQDGDFIVTNQQMERYRDKLNGTYEKLCEKNKEIALHKIAFARTMYMVDNDEKLPEFGDGKIYTSFYNNRFSPKQVEYVEKNIIRPKYGNMELEELYDVMHINRERSSYDLDKRKKKAVANLLNNGFFDKFLNGNVKNLALWDLGKLDNPQEYFGWLYAKNPFTKKLNRDYIIHNMSTIKEEIADSDEDFTKNDKFLALTELLEALDKLNKKGR